ncbi:MAG: amino acid ABC transporter permease [Microbacteriaceae bacterium]|nr:amino acid ABC transporter permease [Microbacteriaceae bacterium]
MSSSPRPTATAGAESPAVVGGEPIVAVKLRHPWRTAFAVLLVVALALFVYDAATREEFQWGRVGAYLFDQRVFQAVGITIALTLLSMLIAIVMGLVLAVMRLSDNPVLKSVSWLFLWLFRGTPVYVQLVFWGLLGTIYSSVSVGFTEIDLQTALQNTFLLAVLGLGLNEAAYMAEIVRAGIQAVPEGQTEASKALGMSWSQTIRRTVLPQAMRIIIPPTGNEFISLLKTTSLVVAVPYTAELYGRATDIANELFLPVPMLLVAATWYLAITSILMVGQHYLERHYAKGATRQLTARQLAALADAEGVPPGNARVVDAPERRFNEEDPR